MSLYILDDANNPIKSETIAAAEWLESRPYRKIVGLTRFPDGTRVSTVFLQVDHGWNGGPPVLWETMVFDTPDDDEFEDIQDRYTSYDEAVEGHIAIVGKIYANRFAVIKRLLIEGEEQYVPKKGT